MKKLLTLLCLAVSLTFFALAGCSDGETFTAKAYSSGDSGVETVSIELSDRQVEISASDDGKVHIDYFDGEKEYIDLRFSENDGLTVKLVIDKKWTDFIGAKPPAEYRKVFVRLPSTVTALSVNTTNGIIKIEKLSVSDRVCISNNGGDIVFDKISAGNELNLSAKNGNIQGSVIGGWDDYSITCTVKKGKSNLPAEKADGGKKLTASCNNGNIDINFEKQ